MKLKGTVIFFLIILLSQHVLFSFAHSGRIDGNGGHRDNYNISGLGYYHYHCRGYRAHLHPQGVCPYGSRNYVYAKEITATNFTSKIDYGQKMQIKATVQPTNAQDNTIVWKSDDPKIVDVSPSGELHAVGIGNTTVTASTSRGTSSVFPITVKEVLVKSIEITFPSKDNKIYRMKKGDQKELTVKITPENTSDKAVKWSVSDTYLAKIDKPKNICG